ncbi:hypothetical protein CPB86DRAFT_808730 [Serendipita vermifera]|nr:hypothetical protein CPB86DRAFT_808730 [Serendipita vermifera]
MFSLLILSLATLASALNPVPLLAYSSTVFSPLDSLQANDQGTALSNLFEAEDVCSFDAVIVATQPALHATHFRSNYDLLLEQYRSAASRLHLPYLTYGTPPAEYASDLAVHCNSKLLHVSADEDVNVALDLSQKHVIHIHLPSVEEIDPNSLVQQINIFSHAFPSHLVLLTGVPASSKRQGPAVVSTSIPTPEPTPSNPLEPKAHRLLTPTLIMGLGIVFGLVVPLFYISITALGSIKSPVSASNYKGPSVEKKNQ